MNATSATIRPPAASPAGLLADIAAGLAAGNDLGPLLGRFLDPIVSLAGADGGAVRVLTDAGDRLELVAAIGLPPEACSGGAMASTDCGPCGAAAAGLPLVWACDASPCVAGPAGAPTPCRQLVAVPLRHRDRVLGVYNLFFAPEREPSAAVRAALQLIGELLGLALNNARLEREQLRANLLRERQRMAADVHDSLAQSLTFMKLRMPLLHDAMQAHDDLTSERYYDELRDALSQAHASVRAIVSQLREPMAPQGLMPALGVAADDFRRASRTELEFIDDAPTLNLTSDQETQVFHIVQEALCNVARHAGAAHAWLRIATAGDNLRIDIEDDGAGLVARPSGSPHYGMDIMAERARRIGATLDIGSRDPGGTRVSLTVPTASARSD